MINLCILKHAQFIRALTDRFDPTSETSSEVNRCVQSCVPYVRRLSVRLQGCRARCIVISCNCQPASKIHLSCI